ncbi:MAG: hypothetical protein DI529_15355, partial [Chryseobacterium sp.]
QNLFYSFHEENTNNKLKFLQMKKLDVLQMESLQGSKSWCSENTAFFIMGVAVGTALAGSGVGTAAGAALLYSCVF